jgi:class 3 adenylate cyclase
VAKAFNLGKILGVKVEGVRVIPISVKIIALFVVFLLLSNFISNYINLTLNRAEVIRLTTDALVRDLKDLYLFAANQQKLWKEMRSELDVYTQQMADFAALQFKGKKSLALGFASDGSWLFQAGPATGDTTFADLALLEKLRVALAAGTTDGSVEFTRGGEKYFGIYRWHADWNAYLVRAEEWNEFYEPSLRIFSTVAVIICGLTLASVVVGIVLIRFILRFVRRITENIMAMQQSQTMDIIDMAGAPNDDVAYLGIAMNSLSSTIQNLLNIFKKFVARDIAHKAYVEREIKLEGSKRELSILFSDIKGFTHMTETLGTDIIKLLNMHYGHAIARIHQANGDIGSIIGDAILAIFGVMPTPGSNKSIQALKAGYEVLGETDRLRQGMKDRMEELIKLNGRLSAAEQQVYDVVQLEVGVGIDGGEVFYGNIGSNERMVNTVIGDNVNSASRLEGLTRVYQVPMIVSDYVRQDVAAACDDYFFLELDTVQVKGKSIGKKVFYPIPKTLLNGGRHLECARYHAALKAYYQGDWPEARRLFAAVALPPARIFEERIRGREAPPNWSGIWTMSEK